MFVIKLGVHTFFLVSSLNLKKKGFFGGERWFGSLCDHQFGTICGSLDGPGVGRCCLWLYKYQWAYQAQLYLLTKTTSISQRKLGDIRVKLCHDSRFPVFLSDGVTDMHYQVLPMIISSIQVLLPGWPAFISTGLKGKSTELAYYDFLKNLYSSLFFFLML